MRIVVVLLLSLFFSLALVSNESVIEQHIYVDKTNTLDVYGAKKKLHEFKYFDGKKASFGFGDVSVWVHVSIANTKDSINSFIIEFPFPPLDSIEVFQFKNSELIDTYHTGDLKDFHSRKVESAKFAFPALLEGKESTEFFFKIKTDGALNLGMKVSDEKSFHTQESASSMMLGGYYGAVVLMLIYNFILFMMIKDKVYIDYVIFHFVYLALQLGLNGHSFQFFWPSVPNINLYYIPITMTLSHVFAIIFTNSFLDIKNILPKMFQFFKWLNIVNVIVILIVMTTPYKDSIKFVTITGIVVASSLFLVGVYILIKYRTRESKYFVTAWSFLLTGVLMGEFQNLGLVNMNAFTLHGPQLGAFFELGLLSFALASKYNDVMKRLISKEAQLQELNKELEIKVENRTSQLQKELSNKNILLKELFHRVKNNLQIVSGLLSLQSNKVKESSSKAIFNESNQQIKAMSILHEKLYKSDNLEAVNMDEYIKDLTDGFFDENLVYNINCIDITLDLERAVPMGLIINELITNAQKHAFKEVVEKEISISMSEKEDSFILDFSDNGGGIEGKDLTKGFGFKLLKSLAVFQLKGKINYFEDSGLRYQIIFPNKGKE